MIGLYRSKSKTAFAVCMVAGAGLAFPITAADTSFTYDALGRVKVVVHGDGTSAGYQYDKAGNRIQVARTVPAGSSPVTITLTASTNLRTLANSNGYTGSTTAAYEFIVPAGTTISGAAGSGRGIDTGAWPAGVTLTLVVNGNVYGGGGNGGSGNSGSGGTGGDAVYAQAPVTITVNSGGSVKGGGGGGAGGAPVSSGPSGMRPGSGGGGGFPNGAGGSYAYLNGYSSAYGQPGTASGGGASGYNQWGAYGGNGGNAGASGASGYNNSSGGGAGYAVRKNGNTVTVAGGGTVTGTVN